MKALMLENVYEGFGEILVYARALPALPALPALHALPAIHALPALPYCFNRLPFIDGALQI